MPAARAVAPLLLFWMAAGPRAQEGDGAAPVPTLTIPAYCGYAHPDPTAVTRDAKTGAVRECRGRLVFYVDVAIQGWLTFRLTRKAGSTVPMTLSCFRHPDDSQGPLKLTAHPLAHSTELDLGRVRWPRPGMLRLELATDDGSPLRDLEALHLGGPAAEGAKTLTVERRNASSVHLWYDVPAEHKDDVAWFYCELTPRTDPLWTYYMATGWHRGYFGMQVNSESERRIIFSVWDAGDEAVDRDKVANVNRVRLVAKGDGVYAGGFGNEGTGGHSHLVHDWRLGDTVRFLVRAEPDAGSKSTTYTGWFSHVHADRPGEPDPWRLVASFRAPKDGAFLKGLYSFSENFVGANGDRLRRCAYGNVWARTQGGEWLPLVRARFTHDGHGDRHRSDRGAGIADGRFFLEHGDFGVPPARRGTQLTLPAQSGSAPDLPPVR